MRCAPCRKAGVPDEDARHGTLAELYAAHPELTTPVRSGGAHNIKCAMCNVTHPTLDEAKEAHRLLQVGHTAVPHICGKCDHNHTETERCERYLRREAETDIEFVLRVIRAEFPLRPFKALDLTRVLDEMGRGIAGAACRTLRVRGVLTGDKCTPNGHYVYRLKES